MVSTISKSYRLRRTYSTVFTQLRVPGKKVVRLSRDGVCNGAHCGEEDDGDAGELHFEDWLLSSGELLRNCVEWMEIIQVNWSVVELSYILWQFGILLPYLTNTTLSFKQSSLGLSLRDGLSYPIKDMPHIFEETY